ncbi:hypothetical protein A3A84_02790 [Candidatus Collierbacteria bacterium RIFCSPLOWO2_01_FULL_50_23]|nr:MAG: hypothetical protein A3A84_02790 [Candidatus Collierbacteria bacterium RIFCSPLOWO2_01_FULL_50_23]
MARDILVLTLVYLISWGLQLLAWPWLFYLNKKLADYGWATGRTLISLVVALSVWTVAHFKIPANTDLGVTLALVALIILTWKARKREIAPAFASLSKIWWLVLAEEFLYLSGFFAYALVRGYQPDILGLEKFMDFGFIKSYLVSPVLPAPDMWWAGSTINYYSFGHFWAGILIRIFGVSAEVGYNLVLAFIMTTGLSLSFSIVVNLLGENKLRKTSVVVSGLMGSLLVVIGGNSHALWSLLSKKLSLEGYWYADATRFIHNTIHEFPAYSFVVSDLHGHVLGFPVVLVFLLLFVGWTRQTPQEEGPRVFYEIALGLLLGAMAMTNTWDAAIYGLLLTIYGGIILVSDGDSLPGLVISATRIGVSALAAAFFWLVDFKSISNGVAAVTERSPIWQLLVLWGTHLSVTVVTMTVAIRKQKKNLLVVAIGLCAVALILIPEFIFVRDIYPNHPRANTMFKLTYQAFIMMGLLFGFLFMQVRAWVRIILLPTFFGLLVFPFVAFPNYYNGFKQYRGLDGFGFVKERFPSDLALIKFLEEHRNGKNMVEAVGDSYSELDFISAFSGVPTVVGWRVHEWLWRGGYDLVGQRDEEVRKFYEEGDNTEAKEWLLKYNVGWIVVTSREREKYKQLNEKKIMSLGRMAWAEGNSYLVKVD